MDLTLYKSLLGEIKAQIQRAQVKAAFAVNGEMIVLYWEIGKMIAARQQSEGWSSGVIPRLAKDIKNDLPEVKGFSERNMGRMLAFYREYPESLILPQAVAKLEYQSLLKSVPWGHHALLMQKIKSLRNIPCEI